MAILPLAKMYLKKKFTKKKEVHFVMIKSHFNDIIQEDTAIVSINVLKIHKAKLAELKEEIEDWTIIVGDFNTSILIMDKISRRSVRK